MDETTRKAKMPNGKVLDVDGHDFVTGRVDVSVGDLIERDLEGCLDMFSDLLTGSTLLMEVGYEPKSVNEDGSISFEVTGAIAALVESDEIEFVDGDEPSAPTP